MGRIDDLIQQYCPEGVEYKPIGDIMYISDYVSAGSFASIRENVTYLSEPSFAILLRFADFSSNFDPSKFVYVDEHAYNFMKKSNLDPGDIIMSNVGSCGSLFACPDLGMPMTLAPNSIVIKTSNNRFYYHWLSSEMAQKEIAKIKSKSAMPKFNKTDFKKIMAPCPPEEVQKAIANSLDKFDRLSAELQAELQARKQQYEYYRNQLLTRFAPEQPVTEYSLGELGTFTYGFTVKAKDNGKIRYIRITDINEGGFLNPHNAKYVDESEEINAYLLKKGDLVMARTGATYGKTLFYEEEYPSIYASFLIKISLKDIVNPRYYWHFSKSRYYWEQANRLVGGGAQPQFNTGAISQVKIPLPPLSEQSRIVAILDKFEALVNDLSQGLPAEIAAVQEQYEYYRNKLLTFKTKE